tara:strand:- start:34 stop:870 length:837 start_codon:yes stop_codon:yes gene_type:complete
MNLVGVGAAGSRIVDSFSVYPQYKRYYVDSDASNRENFFHVRPRPSHEEYEAQYESLDLSHITGDVTVVLAGSGKISGISLRLLEDLAHCNISLLYIKAELVNTGDNAFTREKIVFGVLQEYVRSGLLDKMYIIKNSLVESVLGSVSIANYWQEINQVISSTYHMLNVFKNTEPLLSTITDDKETMKICTMGVVAFSSFDEKTFYDLENARSKKYFFGISQKTLDEEKDLLHKIRSYVADKAGEKCTSCFAIHSTDYEQNYIYVSHHASYVQEQNIDS